MVGRKRLNAVFGTHEARAIAFANGSAVALPSAVSSSTGLVGPAMEGLRAFSDQAKQSVFECGTGRKSRPRQPNIYYWIMRLTGQTLRMQVSPLVIRLCTDFVGSHFAHRQNSASTNHAKLVCGGLTRDCRPLLQKDSHAASMFANSNAYRESLFTLSVRITALTLSCDSHLTPGAQWVILRKTKLHLASSPMARGRPYGPPLPAVELIREHKE